MSFVTNIFSTVVVDVVVVVVAISPMKNDEFLYYFMFVKNTTPSPSNETPS